MKLLALGALLVSSASSAAIDALIPGADVIPASDTAALEEIGAHHEKYHDRCTVTIRDSGGSDDDISEDFLWGLKKANHGGRLLLKKDHTYVIGTRLDLSFLDDIEVQLDGELKACQFNVDCSS